MFDKINEELELLVQRTIYTQNDNRNNDAIYNSLRFLAYKQSSYESESIKFVPIENLPEKDQENVEMPEALTM